MQSSTHHQTEHAGAFHASAVWARAGDVAPIGRPWPAEATQCVMCGVPIAPGDLAMPGGELFKGGEPLLDLAFSNYTDCKHGAGPGRPDAVCGHCIAIWKSAKPGPDWMQKLAKTYAVEGAGVFHLSKDADVAALVLRPPRGRYLAIYSTRQRAHMIWRTSPSEPGRILWVRVNDQVLDIDTHRVLQAWAAWDDCKDILEQIHGHRKARPFWINRTLESFSHGSPMSHRHIEQVRSAGPKGVAAIELLQCLTCGEWWALGALADKPWSMDDPLTWPEPRKVDLLASEADAGDAEADPAETE